MQCFGDEDKHYSAFSAESRPSQQTKDLRFIHSVLGKDDAEGRRAVERAFKQWNLIARDQLRAETGLRLSVGDDTRAVPVKIVDGMPAPLADVIAKFSYDDWTMLINRPRISGLTVGLDFLSAQFDRIAAWLDLSGLGTSYDHVDRVNRLTAQIAEKLKQLDFEARMRSINQDVLGAYFYNIPEIRLYWVAIVLVARILGLPVDAVTLVVTTHELAHAYTHLGRDIDGQRWETAHFARADLAIVEGLAQHYTEMITRRLEQRFPLGAKAYAGLLRIQGSVYHVQADWPKGRATGETVRSAMIASRSTSNREYGVFREQLEWFARAVGSE